MHIQNHITRMLCAFVCALTILFTSVGYAPLQAQASDLPFTGVAGDYLEKLIDMALSKAGVVAEEAIIDKVKDDYITFLLETGNGYLNYLKDNGIDEVNVETWTAYVNQSNLAQWQKEFTLAYPEIAVYYYERYQDNIDGLIISNEEALYALGIPDATYGKQYTLPSVAVNFMRNLFKNRETEYAPYVMIPTYKPEDVPASYFPDSNVRNNFITACSTMTGSDAMHIRYYGRNYSNTGRTFTHWHPDYIPDLFGYVKQTPSTSFSYTYCLTPYDSAYAVSKQHYRSDYTYTNHTTIDEYLKDSYSQWENRLFTPNQFYTSDYEILLCIVTNDGRSVRMFNSLADLKNYDAGQAPYYTTTTYNNWDSSTDNSITYTGDYLIDNSSERSYTTINTSEDYSQTNIDNSVTNITNNYIYTSPNAPSDDEGNGDDGGSNGGLTLGDALNTWVTAIKEFITFALNLLGEAVALLSGFLNDALSLLTGLTDSFSGFTGLLASMFSFLPQEVVDALSAGIILIIVLGVIKGLKG